MMPRYDDDDDDYNSLYVWMAPRYIYVQFCFLQSSGNTPKRIPEEKKEAVYNQVPIVFNFQSTAITYMCFGLKMKKLTASVNGH